MESKGKRKSEGESEEKGNFQPHQYTRNLQRIFQQESNFKFRTLGSYDEDKELLSPAESEPDDIAGDEQIDEPEAVHRRVVSGDPGGGPGGGLELPGRRKSEDFIIIDSDLKEQFETPKRVARKHFLSSPYKDPVPLSGSPDSKDFCPHSWFHVDKGISDSGFCHQMSWKCCFLFFCLPLCYPCYLSRTIRMRLKDEKRKSEEEGGLVFTGQLEVNSTLQSKHSTIHSKHSTLPSKHSTLQSNTRLHNKNADQVNMNIIILQSASSARLLKFIQDAKLLIKLNDDTEHNECDLEVTNHPEHNQETLKSETEEIPKSQTTMKDDSPILLRKHLKSMAPKPPPKSIVKSNSSHYKSAFSEVQPAYSSNKYKSRNSDLFYSLQSNLDLAGQSHSGHDKQPLPLEIQDIHQNKNSSPHSQVLSSLPSMTSGRFYSANSSLFSSMSSPRSVGTVELSPNREDSSDSTDTVKKKKTNAHIEPIVDIVNPHNNAVSVHDLCKANSLDRNTKFTLDLVRNTHSLDRERKVTVASLDNNRGKSFLKKSLSISSPYENMTRVVGSLEQLEIEHKPLSRNNSVKSVKFSSSGSSTVDLSNRKSKFYSFHTHSLARKKISGLKKPPKLGVKQLGTIIEELDSGQKVIQTVNEEGELAGWSSKDIYDIVSKDLPSMDIVVLVVNQDEKKVLDKTLNRSTGVVGYIKEYWSGFFPLLLIELANKNGETEPIESKSLKALNSMFSVIHRIIIDDFESSTDFIFESVARFYSHIKIFQCEKFQQSLHTEKLGQLISLSLTEKFWICSGLCKMRTSQKTKEGRKRGVSLMQTMRNTTILKRVLSGEGTEEENKDENIS